MFESNDTSAFMVSIRAYVNVGSENLPLLSYRSIMSIRDPEFAARQFMLMLRRITYQPGGTDPLSLAIQRNRGATTTMLMPQTLGVERKKGVRNKRSRRRFDGHHHLLLMRRHNLRRSHHGPRLDHQNRRVLVDQ